MIHSSSSELAFQEGKLSLVTNAQDDGVRLGWHVLWRNNRTNYLGTMHVRSLEKRVVLCPKLIIRTVPVLGVPLNGQQVEYQKTHPSRESTSQFMQHLAVALGLTNCLSKGIILGGSPCLVTSKTPRRIETPPPLVVCLSIMTRCNCYRMMIGQRS